MGFDKNFMKSVTKNEQIDYVNRLKSPGAKIALNFALRENVFTTLVCLMNKIPVLIIGNPGSSKSLSTKMIASNFRGVNSTSEFCKKFPEINMIFFQGSESCTSKGVEAVFEKAIKSKEEFASKKK
jgi:E3 ubiquitin-protein ligase RNF213